jgi:hypothetical protein
MARHLGVLAAAVALLVALPVGADPMPMPLLQLSPMTLARYAKKKKKKKHVAAPPLAPDVPEDVPVPQLDVPPPVLEAAPSLVPPTVDVPPALEEGRVAPVTPGSARSEPAGDMGFDLLGESKPRERSAEDLRIEHEVAVRRTMLTTHQVAGLTTLGLLATTSVMGQLSYMDRFSSNAPGTGRFERPHTILAGATVVGFAATGLLAMFAPVPYEKPLRVDTTLAHKLFMGGATLGMLAEAGLGIYTAGREGYGNQRQLAQIHQAIGFTTLGCMGAGAGAFVF